MEKVLGRTYSYLNYFIRKSSNQINLINLSIVFLFLQLFSMPIVFKFFKPNEELTDYLYDMGVMPFNIESLKLMICSFITFLCGSLIIKRKKNRESEKEITQINSKSRLLSFYGLVLFSLGYIYKLFKLYLGTSIVITNAKINNLDPIITYLLSFNPLHHFGLILIGISYYINKRKQNNKTYLYQYAALLLFVLIISTFNGAMAFLIIPLISHILLYIKFKRLNLKKVAILSIILISAISYKLTFKSYILTDTYNFSVDRLVWFSMYRIGKSHTITSVIDNPRMYIHCNLIEQILGNLKLPVYKECVLNGNYFGRHYKLIRSNDYLTGVASSLIGDSYLQLGSVKTYILMFFLGLFYKYFTILSDRNAAYLSVYLYITPLLIHALESPISVILALIIKVLTFMYILEKVLQADVIKIVQMRLINPKISRKEF